MQFRTGPNSGPVEIVGRNNTTAGLLKLSLNSGQTGNILELFNGASALVSSISPSGEILGSRVITSDSAPASNAAGVAGQMIFTDTYTYRCFASGDWRRVAVTYTGSY